jgi:hypothetical protein
MDNDSSILIYVVAIGLGLLIIYFLFRWIFGIDKRIAQNKAIINLLSLIAKKQGATDEEIKISKAGMVTTEKYLQRSQSKEKIKSEIPTN